MPLSCPCATDQTGRGSFKNKIEQGSAKADYSDFSRQCYPRPLPLKLRKTVARHRLISGINWYQLINSLCFGRMGLAYHHLVQAY